MDYEVDSKTSTTYKNLGAYGEFLNRCRVKAWRRALYEIVGDDVSREWVVDLGARARARLAAIAGEEACW